MMKFKLLVLCLSFVAAGDLLLKDDTRGQIELLEFGLVPGGQVNLTMTGLQFNIGSAPASGFPVGVYSRHLPHRSDVSMCEAYDGDDFQARLDAGEYIQHWQYGGNQSQQVQSAVVNFAVTNGGMYTFHLLDCDNIYYKSAVVTTQVRNPNGFISVGDEPLTTMYAWMSAVFCFAAAAWSYIIYSHAKNVIRIHQMMMALLVLKIAVLISDSLRCQFMLNGWDPLGWSVVYYIFLFVKGALSVSLIALIGYGWLLIKAFLSRRDEKLIFAIVLLNLTSTAFQVVMNEVNIGSMAYTLARAAFIIFDIAGCIVLIYPIYQTQQFLTQGAQIEGKAVLNLKRYKLWNRFYMATLAYTYFITIISIFLDEVLDYRSTWLSAFSVEVVTLAFYCAVGYSFLPTDINPYFHLNEQELALSMSDRNATTANDNEDYE